MHPRFHSKAGSLPGYRRRASQTVGMYPRLFYATILMTINLILLMNTYKSSS